MSMLGRGRLRVQPNDSRCADRQEDTSRLSHRPVRSGALHLLTGSPMAWNTDVHASRGFHAFSAFSSCL
jgi:hypothetical protein